MNLNLSLMRPVNDFEFETPVLKDVFQWKRKIFCEIVSRGFFFPREELSRLS